MNFLLLILSQNPIALLLTEPGYLGTISDLPALISKAHELSIPVVIDAAWGAHFGFHPELPRNAIQLGADALITSTHKALPGYSASALLIARSQYLNIDRLEQSFETTHTTSPAGAPLASIDGCRALLQTRGETLISNLIKNVMNFKKTVAKEFSDDVFLKYNGIVNLIFAGFPCQGFSHGGKKLPDDPRNTLFKEFVRATELICPEFIIGENVEGKMYKSFEVLGFDDLMDTNFAADLTILEEGTEFINRVKNGGKLPLFTSCSPGWVNYIEQYEPEFLDNLSTAKSPQQMAGAVSKHYYAEKLGYKKEETVFVSIMPCIAKKHEARRPEMEFDGVRDVDYVLTTREYARLLKRKGVDFMNLEDSVPFGDLAKYSGAAVIFGATGGVMEAALRTVSEILEGEITPIEYTAARGMEGIKEATLNVAGIDVNIAVVHGGSSIKDFFAKIKKSKKQYHFVEFMACTGGCINGGGQPIHPAKVQDAVDIRAERAKTLYEMDSSNEKRKSHNNPFVMGLYKDWLTEPGSHKAHDLLHTKYKPRNFYK